MLEQSELKSRSQGGAEVLLVDCDARVRGGFRKLLSNAGVIVTATEEPRQALSLASQKHFAVAVVDLDTPTTDAGFGVMEQLREVAPATRVVLLSARQIFSVAVEAFRRGAADVVSKSPENINQLIDVVLQQCKACQAKKDETALLTRSLQLHEDFLKRLMEASRSALQAEAQSQGASADEASVDTGECMVLVVDDDPNTPIGLQRGLNDPSFKIVAVQTGGEALDFVGGHKCQLALVKDGLPDLPSSMVAKSVRSEASDGIVVLFSHPTATTAGRADIIESTQSIELIPELTSGMQLVEQIRELRQAYVAKANERRYLQRFRSENFDLLRRYVQLRQEIVEILPAED